MDFVSEYSSESDDQNSSYSEASKSSSKHEHIVQFYDTRHYLLDVLSDSVFPILETEHPVIIIAVKPFLDDLESRLSDRGIPVLKKKADNQLLLVNAHEMLTKIMDPEDSSLSMGPLKSHLSGILDQCSQVYVYGELVDLLCSLGKYETAVLLEEMWNELIGQMKSTQFTLLCGYDMNNFKDERLRTIFSDVCRTHSRVGPSEDCSSFRGANDHDSMIAQLKQKACALETEVERRKATENALQHSLELLSTRAEASLRSQQESHHTLLSILPVGVYSSSLSDDDTFFVNSRFYEISGLSEAQIRIYGWHHVVHPEDRERVRHLWDLSILTSEDSGPSTPFGGKEEYRYVRADGSVRWVTGETVLCSSPSHHELSGYSQMYVHTIVDITELKNVERQRQKASRKAEELLQHRAEQAERHKREQDQFIDTLCHELRNPLSSILGNVELLQMGLKWRETLLASVEHILSPNLVGRVHDQRLWDQESISAIEKCVAHQKVITDDVLILSKLGVGKVVLRNTPFDPRSTIVDVTKMFEAEANRKGLLLRSNLPAKDVIIRGDPDRVSQVLINLLANALKFTTCGCITLGLDFVERNEGRLLTRVTVTDTGIGLTQQEKAKLFHRFMQPASSAYDEGGSGLGLVISKGLVELMGGTISVESVKGHGSSFTFTFYGEEVVDAITLSIPLASNEGTWPDTVTPPETPKEEVPPSIRKRHIKDILIVEDNVVNQRYLFRLLEAEGYQCGMASNGMEALTWLEGNKCDLVMMDVHMPVMDGIACTRQIRAREDKMGLPHIPIVGLSGNAREEHKRDALDGGMNHYLTKPCKKDELYAAIRRCNR